MEFKIPSKLDMFFGLLKPLSFIEDAKSDFIFDVLNFNYDNQKNLVTLDGFAATRNAKLPVDFFLADSQGEVVEFERTNIFLINKTFEIPEDVDVGFHLVIKMPEDVKEVHKVDLLLKSQDTGQFLPVVGRDDMHLHFSKVDGIEYYMRWQKQHGLTSMIDQFKKQGFHIWNDYNYWLDKQPKINPEILYGEMGSFAYNPKISIVVPVYNVEEKWLRRMIESVLNQYYENWELILSDDHSPSQHVRKILSEYAAMDPRIKMVERSENGHISEATNTALNLATGDYIGFMDHDDEMEYDTLFEVVKAINENPGADFLYTDQDYIDVEGYRTEPFFKPHWNPRWLLAQNYISHFLVVSRELLEKTGKLRSAYDGSQDYDFSLRAVSNADKVVHIPKMLYHWRIVQGSVADDPEAKDYAYERGKNAINDYLRRRGIENGHAVESQYYGVYDLVREDKPSVSIILLANEGINPGGTLKELLEKTHYENFEIVAVNFDDADKVESDKVKYYYNNAPLSIKQLYDFAAQKATGEYLVLFIPGTSPQNTKTDWLENMVNETVLPETGVVGAFLYGTDTKILNGGMSFDLIGSQMMYTHMGRPVTEGDIGYYFRLAAPQNVVAVSSACLLISKKLFEELGGYKEEYDMPLRELDLSLRAKRLGKLTVWQPNTKMMWTGEIEEAPNLHKKERPAFYTEAHPNQLASFFKSHSEEELQDPYTQDIIQRFRRLANPKYRGPKEYRIV